MMLDGGALVQEVKRHYRVSRDGIPAAILPTHLSESLHMIYCIG